VKATEDIILETVYEMFVLRNYETIILLSTFCRSGVIVKETKDIILETAYEMFVLQNYEAVTLSGICAKTRLTKGALYHYFQSKEALFKAVVERYLIAPKKMEVKEMDTLYDLICSETSAIKSRAEEYRSNVAESINASPRQHLSLLMAAYRYYPDFKLIGDGVINVEVAKWKRHLEKAIKNKEIRGDIDIDAIATTFITIFASLVMGMVHNSSLDFLSIVKKQMDGLYNLLKIT